MFVPLLDIFLDFRVLGRICRIVYVYSHGALDFGIPVVVFSETQTFDLTRVWELVRVVGFVYNYFVA
jgi:hypothetical protein